MQTARVTFLTTPDRKAALERQAVSMGVSSGELVRLAVDRFSRVDSEEEKALAALAVEVRRVVPEIRASLDRSSDMLEATHRKVDALLRDMGVRA